MFKKLGLLLLALSLCAPVAFAQANQDTGKATTTSKKKAKN